jgi:protein involved in polysaccharide export with SLBB domain
MNVSGIPREEADMSRQYTIGNDGTVNIALADQIQAAGLTQSQLERAIEARYREKKIFRWPAVSITVQAMSRYVTIGGAVRIPQRYVWAADLSLSAAITAAGGPGDFGGDKVDLIRGGKRTTYSLKNIRRNPGEDPRLMPGDQIEMR